MHDSQYVEYITMCAQQLVEYTTTNDQYYANGVEYNDIVVVNMCIEQC